MCRWVCAVATLVVACGKGDAPAPSSGSGSGPTAPGSASGSGTPDAQPATPVSATLAAARCGEPCLFLLDHAVEDVPEAYKTACGKDVAGFGFDDCKQLDYARNCIYAAHGKVYTKKKWKTVFAKKPWYERHPDFVETSFTAVEKANVHELYVRGKACKKGIHISTADRDRVKAWFAVLPKTPPMPPLVFDQRGEKISGDAFVKALSEELELELKINGRIDPGTATVSYADLDSDATEMDFEHGLRDALPPDHAKLRPVLVDFALPGSDNPENPVNEGVYVVLVYDAKDQLVGVALGHYLLD